MSTFIIKNATGILTGLNGELARATGDVRVVDGIIAEIGDLTPTENETVIDASNGVIAPGLVNTHHHLFQSVLKAIPEGLNHALTSWLRTVPYSYWDKLDEDALRVSTTIGLAELVLSGATTVADHHYLFSERYDFHPADVLFQCAQQFGVRFVLARGGATCTRKLDSDKQVAMPTETLEQMIASVEQTAAQWHDPSPNALTRVAFAPTTPTFSLLEAELKPMAQAARSMGLRMHSHLSENMDYVHYTAGKFNLRPVEWLAKHDWLGEDVWFAHLVECEPFEIDLLVQSGTSMAHCPQANARLGSGIAPADLMHNKGGTVSLAVDGAAANEAADMHTALYSAFTHHRAQKGAGATTAETVLHWATKGGAKALGFDNIGTIEVGKAADIIIFDLNSPRYFGQHDRVISPIISSGAQPVKHSFVAGKPIVIDGKIPWLDMEKLAVDALNVVNKIKQKMNANK